MKCPFCTHDDSRVIDSREVNDVIRRRRQCLKCNERFTTYERIQIVPLYVIKKDQRCEEFDKEKLLRGLHKACEKRPLETRDIEKLADEVENELLSLGRTEVSATLIGDKVMYKLKKLDNIAYIRFASVYRSFTDITEFKNEIDNLVLKNVNPVESSQLPLIPSERARNQQKSRRNNN